MENKFPIFYKEPVALNEERHVDFGLLPQRDFSFALSSNVVPLSASEFVFACRHYPIVFSKTGTPLPLALVGLQDGTNYFVDDAGNWEHGTYVPAYVRRYPFILMQGEASDQFFLCVDEASSAIGKNAANENGERFFTDKGEHTDVTRQASEFCRVYQQDHDLAKTFCEELQKHDLFTDSEVVISVNGEETRLRGFQAIDKDKLEKLDDKIVIDWHKRGFLALAAHHAASMHAWSDLAIKGIGKTKNEKQ